MGVERMRSTKIAPLSLSTSYLTGSESFGISMTTLISSGGLRPELTWSRPICGSVANAGGGSRPFYALPYCNAQSAVAGRPRPGRRGGTWWQGGAWRPAGRCRRWRLEAWPAGAAGRPHWALRHMVRTLRTARARPQLAEKCMGRGRRPGEGGRRRPLESRGSPRRWTPRIMNERIAHAGLASRLMSAEQAAALIQPGMAVGMSGFTGAGYPKAVPKALASRIEAAHGRGEQFAIRILT